LKRSDAESLAANMNNRKVQQYLNMTIDPYTAEHARKWINQTHRLAREDRGYHFGIQPASMDEAVGCIGLKNLNRESLNVELGYWIGERYWKQGLMTEAVSLILGFVFDTLKFHRVYAIVHSGNLGSVRLLEKSHFVREGIYREAHRTGSKWHDVYFYGLLKREWKDTQSKPR